MRTATAFLGSLIGLAAFACQAQPAAAGGARPPIRVGFLCPQSGPSKDFGSSARLGVELAVQEVNEVGGYAGRLIQLVQRDDKGDPDAGRQASLDLVKAEKVDFTIGFCNTGVAAKSLDVFQDNRHPLLIAVATGSVLTQRYPAAESYVFRMAVRDLDQAAFLVDEVVDRKGLRQVAVFADRSGYGEGGLRDIDGFLEKKGLRPVYIGRFDTGVASLADELRNAAAKGAQAIIAYTLAPEFAALAKSRAEAGYAGPVYGSSPLSFRTVWERAGRATDGMVVSVPIIRDFSNERRTSFIARLRRHAGNEPIASLLAAAQSYDALHLMVRILFQTKGDIRPEAVKRALENMERPYVGVVTTHEKPFSAQDHDAFTKNMMWAGVWRAGEVEFLHKEDERSSSVMRKKEARQR